MPRNEKNCQILVDYQSSPDIVTKYIAFAKTELSQNSDSLIFADAVLLLSDIKGFSLIKL